MKMKVQFETRCLHCKKLMKGRADKKFCSHHCRNQYNNARNAVFNTHVRFINHILRQNRSILERFVLEMPEKPVTIQQLSVQGFSFFYFTHQMEVAPGELWTGCYDLGYIRKEGDTLLIQQITPNFIKD